MEGTIEKSFSNLVWLGCWLTSNKTRLVEHFSIVSEHLIYFDYRYTERYFRVLNTNNNERILYVKKPKFFQEEPFRHVS